MPQIVYPFPAVRQNQLEKRSQTGNVGSDGKEYDLQRDTYAIEGTAGKYFFNDGVLVPTQGTTKTVFLCTNKDLKRCFALQCIKIAPGSTPPPRIVHPCLTACFQDYTKDTVLQQLRLAASYQVGTFPIDIIDDGQFLYVIDRHLSMTLNELRTRLHVHEQSTEKVELVYKYLLREILKKMVVLHESDNPCIHFDIKYDNLMIGFAVESGKDENVDACIIDFGSAHPGKEAPNCGKTTPMVAPPTKEEAFKAICNQKFDIYSLGVTFAVLCAGTNPFARPSGADVHPENYQRWYSTHVQGKSLRDQPLPNYEEDAKSLSDWISRIHDPGLNAALKTMITPKRDERPSASNVLAHFFTEPSPWQCFLERPFTKGPRCIVSEAEQTDILLLLRTLISERSRLCTEFDFLKQDLKTIAQHEPGSSFLNLFQFT